MYTGRLRKKCKCVFVFVAFARFAVGAVFERKLRNDGASAQDVDNGRYGFGRRYAYVRIESWRALIASVSKPLQRAVLKSTGCWTGF